MFGVGCRSGLDNDILNQKDRWVSYAFIFAILNTYLNGIVAVAAARESFHHKPQSQTPYLNAFAHAMSHVSPFPMP